MYNVSVSVSTHESIQRQATGKPPLENLNRWLGAVIDRNPAKC